MCLRIIFHYPDYISLRVPEMRLVAYAGNRPFRDNNAPPGCDNLIETLVNRINLCGYENSWCRPILFSCNTAMNSRF